MKLHLEILPASQREFWDRHVAKVPKHFVLYGGTAIALHLGHRESLDFDFFTDRPIDEKGLQAALPALRQANLLQQSPNTLVVSLILNHEPVKLSFFGGLSFGRIAAPIAIPDRMTIASRQDLLATKMKVLHDRVEAKDYLDIEALLRSGLSLNEGLAGAMALYGQAINALDTAKAIAWFKDGGLDQALSLETQAYLIKATKAFDPKITPTPRQSASLSDQPARGS